MATLSIVIPSKTERFLERTIRDVLAKATGSIEVFPVLDGYEPPEYIDDPRVHYIHFDATRHSKKRQAINFVSEICSGEYLMSLDAHCMLSEGFDEVLLRDIQDDWVVVPRRNRLDAENWCLQTQVDNRPPIDYEYLMYPLKFDPPAFHGFKWDAKTLAKKDVMQDDIITMQGSAWCTSLKWFKKMGFMQVEGYQGWGQEAEELSFTTWCRGGRVVVNKAVEQLHLHKGPRYGRFYYLDKRETDKSYRYSYDFWMHNKLENKIHTFGWLIDKFMPMPGWSENWREELGYRE
jgi:hypothetical protein